jgi:UDPglucose--hexose-1-phosphate uridylyltransferase
VLRQAGPYKWQDGVGFHEVVFTREHTRSLAAMTPSEAAMVLSAYRDRYRALEADGCVRYISIFHNHGRPAGATISHPHSQIIAIPVVPPDIGRSLRGSGEYYRKYRQCVHCTMLRFERKEKRRVIFANSAAIVFCPFVSRQAFEVRVFPIRHNPRFEEASARELAGVADALRIALAKIGRSLGDPAYNFFIHTAPVQGSSDGRHYHWHIEIIPKTAVWAGFEIGTGIEISTTSPEAAAAFLRKIRV